MRVLASKATKMFLVIVDLIIGVLLMVLGFVVVPIGVFTMDPLLLQEPLAWIVVIAIMVFFGLVGYFANIRQLALFKKSPAVQAETDGEYLYIYGKKEAKIPLKEMAGSYIDTVQPYIMSYEFILSLISEAYGKIVIDTPNHGKYKLYFIKDAKAVAQELYRLIDEAQK